VTGLGRGGAGRGGAGRGGAGPNIETMTEMVATGGYVTEIGRVSL